MNRSWIGTLRRALPGMGPWTLTTDRGRRYALVGSIPASLECERVTIHGQPAGLPLAPAIRVLEVHVARLLGGF